ncbi:MAG: cob(I)yrinic acid a,c-diamide adenosyltransferase [Candidatus Omnitrophica bacterium]|nr:cob(I)yrinic acid a,c-diamide adenosyltransferase [Candidatus Omnitrophota bacterium]
MTSKGLVHIYTGDGKGKTTAALGLAMRACGQGMKVLLVQFLKPKGRTSGELKSINKLKGIDVMRFDESHPIFWGNGDGKDSKKLDDLKRGLKERSLEVEAFVLSGKYDVIILDEAVNCVSQGLMDINALKHIMLHKPEKAELVLTGRGAPKELIDIADYVTEMKEVKHPYRDGVKARKGIET